MDEMTKKLIELYEQNIALLKENSELKLKLAQKNNSYPSITVTPLADLPQIGTISSTSLKYNINGIPHVG
jgi:hypothetical protein